MLYDPQTRSELQTSQPLPSKNNKRDKLITNANGSVDLYFGPNAPAYKQIKAEAGHVAWDMASHLPSQDSR